MNYLLFKRFLWCEYGTEGIFANYFGTNSYPDDTGRIDGQYYLTLTSRDYDFIFI